MDKQELIEKIQEMPDDIQIFVAPMEYDAIDIRIFTAHKEPEFLSWYFGP